MSDYGRYVGASTGDPLRARFPVERGAIGRWCDAVGDQNPVYHDAGAARAAGFADLVAPPVMIDTWTAAGFSLHGPPPGLQAGTAAAELLAALSDAGYTGIVATDCDQSHARYLHPGESVTCAEAISEVSEEKATGLGVGHFVTVTRTYSADREDFASMIYRRLYFKPGTARPPRAQKAAAGPAGAQLPDLNVSLTRSVIVAGAVASNDYYPGHHDPQFARRAGLDDVFMNIRTTNGWLARYVSDWAGPEGRITQLAVRLGAPNYPQDTMRISGTLEADERDADAGVRRLRIALAARNGLGLHAGATVELTLPAAAELPALAAAGVDTDSEGA